MARIAYYSPMPPEATGVADYSAALVPYLRELGEVLVNPEEVPPAPDWVPVYHVGNNQLHAGIYRRAIAEPGVTVLHDAVLQHFYLGSLSEAEYVAEFVYNYGDGGGQAGEDAFVRSEAETLWRERARSGADPRYFARPMLRRIAEASRAVIVHNPGAAAAVREHAANTCVHEIPHLYTPPPVASPGEVDALRRELGCGPRTLLIGCFGHQRETKRLHSVIRALRKGLDEGADLRLLIAGSFGSEPYRKSLAADLEHPRIIQRGYLSEAEMWRYAAAVDVCVNLRYPSAAESSGIATRMMGIGKAVICTRDRAIANLPELACLRVDPGPAEVPILAGMLTWLAGNRAALRKIGDASAEYVTAKHAPRRVARLYWDVVDRVAG